MRKLLALVLAMLALIAMMSFAVAEEPLTITVMLPDFYTDVDFETENNPVLDAIEAASGVRLDIQWVANSSYGDMTSLTLADPDNMPMLMVATGARDPIIVNSARAGAFWDITDYIKDYPNLAAGSEGIYNNISVDGRLYGIYRSRAQARGGIYYRKDIAAKMGITEEPKTIEELTALAKALSDYSDDTYALNMVKYVAGTIGIITVAHGAPFNWGVNAEGQIYPAHEDPAFLEGLNWLRSLYAEGGINPDFMTIEAGEWDSIERTGKAFMRFDCMDNCYRQQEWFEKNEGITEEIWAMVPAVAAADGNMYMWPQNAGYSGEIVITKSVKDEETLKKVLAFLDWTNTAEGQTLINWGVDGQTYWIREDGFRYTNPSDDVDMSLQVQTLQHSLNQLGTNVTGDLTPAMKLTTLREEYNSYQKSMMEYIVNDPCHPLTSETYNSFGTTLSQMLEDAHVQYIAGIINEDELRAVWQAWSDEGGAMMTMEYNEAYQASIAK